MIVFAPAIGFRILADCGAVSVVSGDETSDKFAPLVKDGLATLRKLENGRVLVVATDKLRAIARTRRWAA